MFDWLGSIVRSLLPFQAPDEWAQGVVLREGVPKVFREGELGYVEYRLEWAACPYCAASNWRCEDMDIPKKRVVVSCERCGLAVLGVERVQNTGMDCPQTAVNIIPHSKVWIWTILKSPMVERPETRLGLLMGDE